MSYIHPPDKQVSDSELSTLLKEASKYFMDNFDNLPNDVIPVNIYRNFTVLAKKDSVVDVIVEENRTVPVLKPYLEEETVIVDGDRYHLDSSLITKTNDTKKFILKEKAYKSVEGYYSTDKNLVKHPKGYYIHKDNAVICKDTKLPEHRHTTYHNRKDEHYKYSTMAHATEDWRHAPYVDETIMPEINERRIGLEYEFGNTFDMFKDFCAGDYKFKWLSTRDGSLDRIRQGIEFVSVPFKMDELDQAVEFLKFCEKQGAKVPDACGFHVHIGAQDFSFMDLTRMIALGTSIEDEMFRLGGEHRGKNTYCKKLSERFTGFSDIILPKDKKKAGDELYKGLNATFEERHRQSKYVDANNHTGIRYYWLNIDRYFYKRNSPSERTIEFRNHIATFDGERFKNYALLCYYAVEYAKNHSKKTCKQASVYDIVGTSQLKHRKQLMKYLTENL